MDQQISKWEINVKLYDGYDAYSTIVIKVKERELFATLEKYEFFNTIDLKLCFSSGLAE